MNYRYVPLYVRGNALTEVCCGQWTIEKDKDIDYVKEMYPVTFLKIQELVDRECDHQEFTGSMMFDEYPDKFGLQIIINRIFKLLKEDEKTCDIKQADCNKYPEDSWLKDIIKVLLLNEMFRRKDKRRQYY